MTQVTVCTQQPRYLASHLYLYIMKERIIRVTASGLILLSLTLAYLIHVYWLALAIVVGIGLFQSTFTRFCLLERILDSVGIKDSSKPNG